MGCIGESEEIEYVVNSLRCFLEGLDVFDAESTASVIVVDDEVSDQNAAIPRRPRASSRLNVKMGGERELW